MAVTQEKPKERGMFIRMDSDLHRRLRKFAFETERPQADLIREALSRYLDANESAEAKSA